MKNGNGHHKKDDFIAPARRAFSPCGPPGPRGKCKLGLPLVLGENGHLRLVRAR